MRFLILLTCSLFLLSACEENIYQEIRKEDILQNGGLSVEYNKLRDLGVEGYSQDGDHITFYVEDPNEETRKKLEEGLVKIFGETLDFSLQEDDQFNLEVKPLY